MDPWSSPVTAPSQVRAIGTPESPLPFQKQKISFTINILLRHLISSSRSLKVTGQWLRSQSSRHPCSGPGRPLEFLRTAVVSCVPVTVTLGRSVHSQILSFPFCEIETIATPTYNQHTETERTKLMSPAPQLSLDHH